MTKKSSCCASTENVDVSVLRAGGVSHVMYKLHFLAKVFTDPVDKFLQELKLGLGHLAILHWDYAPFPALNLRCSQRLLQGFPSLFHAGLFHELVRASVETQTRHSLQLETHVFVSLTKTRVRGVVPDELDISERGEDT